jgi:hypothetical protein
MTITPNDHKESEDLPYPAGVRMTIAHVAFQFSTIVGKQEPSQNAATSLISGSGKRCQIISADSVASSGNHKGQVSAGLLADTVRHGSAA